MAKRKFWQEGGNRVLTLYLQAPDARCPKCRSRDIRAHWHRDRTLVGLPNGRCQVRFVVPARKVVCRVCGAAAYERVPFAAYRNARITRSLAKRFLERAATTSMKELAAEHRVSWRTVRDAIEDGLRKRYRRRDFSEVRNIGVDELYVFPRERPGRKYITVVRDQDSRAVLEVARGKGAAALRRFERKIGPFKGNIRSVSMDMASSFTSWSAAFLPSATVVVDRFHVVKALNDRVDKARRKVMAMVDEKTAKRIKGNRYLFLKNRESLTARESRKLESAVKVEECATLAEGTSSRSGCAASTPTRRPTPPPRRSSTSGSGTRRRATSPSSRARRGRSRRTATASSRSGRRAGGATPRRRGSTGR